MTENVWDSVAKDKKSHSRSDKFRRMAYSVKPLEGLEGDARAVRKKIQEPALIGKNGL